MDEFCKNVYVKHLNVVEGCGVPIIWQWVDGVEHDEDTDVEDDEDPGEHRDESLLTDSDLEEEKCNQTSTVSFKCIGVTRDSSYQETLKEAHKLMKEGKSVLVRVEPEPNNPYDSHAVAFQCLIGCQWQVIGYAVKEVCDSVLEAVSSNSIVSVEFAWLKYKILRTTGPGYYTAINIKRKQDWPPIVHRLASTMY